MIGKHIRLSYLAAFTVVLGFLTFVSTHAMAQTCDEFCHEQFLECLGIIGSGPFCSWGWQECQDECPDTPLEVDLRCGLVSNGAFSCSASVYGGSGSYQYDWDIYGGIISSNYGDTISGSCGAIATMSVTVDDGYSIISDSFTMSCLTSQL